MIEFLIENSWIIWVVLIAVFLLIEMFTLDFTFLMLAVGSLVGCIAALLFTPFPVQVILVAVTAMLLIFLLRPPLLKKLRGGAPEVATNVDALLGMTGLTSAETNNTSGQVKLSNGELWSARTPLHTLPVATAVIVDAIEGATVVVSPVQER